MTPTFGFFQISWLKRVYFESGNDEGEEAEKKGEEDDDEMAETEDYIDIQPPPM